VDLAVLAVGLRPGDNTALKEVMKLPVGPDGFFLEAHPKLRPLETVLDGIYLAGACQGPKDLAESITQGSGAAGKILALMAHDTITLDGLICEVDPDRCSGCESCYHECPFQAVEMVGEGKSRQARIIEAACKGCVCAGPAQRAVILGFDAMILARSTALAEIPKRKVLAFCCNWCLMPGGFRQFPRNTLDG
jgi:heterodisulfide reductase subunit A